MNKLKTFKRIFSVIMAMTLSLNMLSGDVQFTANAASKISLSKTKLTIEEGSTKTIKVKNAPKGASVKYSSSKKSVAKVSQKGVVTAIKKGKAAIRVKVKYTQKKKKKVKNLKCLVTVKENIYPVVKAAGMKEADYVDVSDPVLKKNTISSKVMAQAKKVTDISPDNLPAWHGSTLPLDTLYLYESEEKARNYFIEQDFKAQADMGFDYLRFTLEYPNHCKEEGDTLKVDKNVWESIDNAIAWCVKYGIHLNLDLHTHPGYNWEEPRDILENKTHYDMSLALWAMAAARYADVPSGVLSYNLVNEPERNYFKTDEKYAGWANDMIDTIRAQDHTSKVIVSDGFLTDGIWEGACASMPVEGLPKDVVQAIHLYPYHSYNRNADMQFLNWPYKHLPVVGGDIYDGSSMHVEAELEEKSEIDVWFASAYGIREGLSFAWKTSAGESGSFDFSNVKENPDKNYVFSTDEDMTFAEFGMEAYDGVKLTIPIGKAANSITFSAEDGNVILDQILIRHYTGKEQKYYYPSREHDGPANPYGPHIQYGSYKTEYYMFSKQGQWLDSDKTITFKNDTITCPQENPTLDYFDVESLDSLLKIWRDFSKRTGEPIIVNEFEILAGLPSDVRATVLDSELDAFEKYDIPWALYTANWDWSPRIKTSVVGYITDPRWTVVDLDDGWRLKGEWYYDTAALDILKKHMNK